MNARKTLTDSSATGLPATTALEKKVVNYIGSTAAPAAYNQAPARD